MMKSFTCFSIAFISMVFINAAVSAPETIDYIQTTVLISIVAGYFLEFTYDCILLGKR